MDVPPGTTFEYSNTGSGLLGYAIAANDGLTYEEMLKARVLSKLGLKDTGVELTKEQAKRLLPGHVDQVEIPNLTWNADNALAGAGGLKSSTRELVKFMKANMKASTHKFGQQLDLAQTVMHVVEGDGYWGRDLSMGLGWYILEDDANTFYMHAG